MRREASLEAGRTRKRRLPPGLAEGGNGEFESRLSPRTRKAGGIWVHSETVTENSKFVTQKSGNVTKNSGNGNAGEGQE
jgi:hypothetical protein